jgi:hypothetical protein
MKSFAAILTTLPAIDDIEKIELYDGDTLIDTIDNKPGKAGSVAVYHALLQEFGSINKAAAEKGLSLYAEHTADAQTNPGKHPNIDRFFSLIERNSALQGKIINKQ